jgi:hypothetical protein
MDLEKFKDLTKYNAVKFRIDCTWTSNDLNFDWIETVQTKEVPDDDPWDSFTTDMKRDLEEIHKEWKIPDQSTWHLMSHCPSLNENLKTILDKFPYKTLSYNFIKITPGHMLVWHFDTYATFVHRKNLTIEYAETIKRSVILMNDWDVGQVIQIGNELLGNWTAGDVYTWESFAWHGTCNFGKSDIIAMQISYLDE